MTLQELIESRAIYSRIDIVVVNDKATEEKIYKGIKTYSEEFQTFQDLQILYIKPCCIIQRSESVYQTHLTLENYLEITLRG